VKAQKVELNIDPDKINIELTGSLVAEIADLFKDLFKKVIVEQVKQKTIIKIQKILDE
jgi:hypothetical protein